MDGAAAGEAGCKAATQVGGRALKSLLDTAPLPGPLLITPAEGGAKTNSKNYLFGGALCAAALLAVVVVVRGRSIQRQNNEKSTREVKEKHYPLKDMPHELAGKTGAKSNHVSPPRHRKNASSEGQSAADEMRDVPSQLPRKDLGNRVFYDLLQLYTSVKPVQVQRTQPNNQNQQQTRSKRSANARVAKRATNGYESELGGVAAETETRRRAHQRNAESLGYFICFFEYINSCLCRQFT
jgi:hypothetical protein